MSKTQINILEKLNGKIVAVYNGYTKKWYLLNGKIEMYVPQQSINSLYKKGFLKEDGRAGQGRYKYVISLAGREYLKENKQ